MLVWVYRKAEGCQATSRSLLELTTRLVQLQQLELGTPENILKMNIEHMFTSQNQMGSEVSQAIASNLKKLQKLLARNDYLT